MVETNSFSPAYLFEVSWEVCNKVGGIHTVVSTKALSISKTYKENHILIGPDLWRCNDPHPEFEEDTELFPLWRMQAASEGLHVKVGRWKIAAHPIVVLVDFTSFMSQKDAILARFWEQYKLDSISGQWDYVEPLLFGYASGKVIESFYRFSAATHPHAVAQFHEWMTGSGLLYLRASCPQVGTVFTTHATVLGRCIAGNGLPLYNEMGRYNPSEMASRFRVSAKQSLERLSAVNADCFTTVSEITSHECEKFLGKPVDVITPNGFEPDFVPSETLYPEKRDAARRALTLCAEKVLGFNLSQNPLFVCIGGRYEFKNKGIDLFVDALGTLNRTRADREIVAFVLVPAGHRGVNTVHQPYVSHELENFNGDPVVQRCLRQNLTNQPESRVKVVFVPCYLDGKDGVLNLSYYEVLPGMDAAVFPSYYEPWGYTPLESLSFGVPTITTTLAGFGLWVESHCEEHPSVEVIARDDYNDDQVVMDVVNTLERFAHLEEKERVAFVANAKKVSTIALWKHLVQYYYSAYETALAAASRRSAELPPEENTTLTSIERQTCTNQPGWVNITISRSIPQAFSALEELSRNLWWCWNDDSKALFRLLDPERWEASRFNPIQMLDQIPLSRYKELEQDASYMELLHRVQDQFTEYMKGKNAMAEEPGVAYFSMEYGLQSSLKIYSGGLGILAGDYLKESSDKQVKMTAVGLLYRYGYFKQKLSTAGHQEAEYEPQDFSKIPVNPVWESPNKRLIVSLPLPGRNLKALVWRVDVGRTELYLLDTDFEANSEEDRRITHHLYGGDWENRLKQEMLLGCGGIRLLNQLGLHPEIYHCNEGHAAFIGLERLAAYVGEGRLLFDDAKEVVRASSLFTTHTPVPAGHDAFSEELLRRYLSHYPDLLKISWHDFLALGKINAGDPNEKFSMSYLAANLSQEINGVSWLHGKVSQKIFKDLWPGYFPEESHISYVTNGVHHPTWTAPEWKRLYRDVFGESFRKHSYEPSAFEGIFKASDETVMGIRQTLRSRLIVHIKKMLADPQMMTYFSPREIVAIRDTLRDDILTIGFARRFATYKRAHLLFRNLDRLDHIVNNPDHPVQFIFAGKAHPADLAGQDLITRIIEVSKRPRFLGKIIFLPNYDMDLARWMVQGVDVWMNTPTRPQEASGTSGEKAAMNGVMHFSVLDGWWVEGYRPDSGWALPMERTYENQAFQDELDSELIYNIIEDEIAETFYHKNAKGISPDWAAFVKNCIAHVASNFTTNRMLTDYEERFYNPMKKRVRSLVKEDYAEALMIAEWKRKVRAGWDAVTLEKLSIPDYSKQTVFPGKTYLLEALLNMGTLSQEDVSVELVISQMQNGESKVIKTLPFKPIKQTGSRARYQLNIEPNEPGNFNVAVRIYPYRPFLPHRQDFSLVKWL